MGHIRAEGFTLRTVSGRAARFAQFTMNKPFGVAFSACGYSEKPAVFFCSARVKLNAGFNVSYLHGVTPSFWPK